MIATAKGVSFNGPQLAALLEFASKEKTDRNKYGVLFVVKRDRVWARCTNGQVALELDGESDGQLPDGEWFVGRDFLVKGRHVMTGKQALRLAFAGASLNHAFVEENGVEICNLGVPQDAAIAQVAFPFAKPEYSPPARKRAVAHCSALSGAHAGLLELVEKACGVHHTDLYPPETPEQRWIFVCGDGQKTVARGSLEPKKSDAATVGDGGDGDEDDSSKGGRRKNARQQELVQ